MGRMKQEKDSNKKMLLEMSGLVRALQDISVDYERQGGDGARKGPSSVSAASSGGIDTALNNVQLKIQAIDQQMRHAKERCGLLQEEKSIQNGTIRAQESQIKSMEDQIKFLVDRLEQQSYSTSKEQSELERILQLQETQIHSLESQIDLLRVSHAGRAVQDFEIRTLAETNANKYAEIDMLEEKLAALREAQNAHKIKASLLKNKQEQEEKEIEDGETAVKAMKEQEAILMTPEQLKEHQDHSSPDSEKDLLALPTLVSKPIARSARKKKYSSFSSGGSSNGSSSPKLEAISEDGESQFDSQSGHVRDGTAASVAHLVRSASTEIGDPSGSTHSSSSSSSSHSEATSSASSSSSPSLGGASVHSQQRTIQMSLSEDGSVEVMTLCPEEDMPKEPSIGNVMADDESSVAGSSGWSSRSSRSLSVTNRGGPEEDGNDGGLEWDTVSEGHSVGSDQNQGKRHLLEQLEEARSRHDKLKQAYNIAVAESATKIDKLDQENKMLRGNHGSSLSSVAQVSEVPFQAGQLKEDNEKLSKELERQQALTALSNAKYEKLRVEHSKTLEELQSKSSRYDQLVEEYSNIATRTQDAENYRSLEQIHNAVVMKLADMGEDNENLQKERDAIKEQLNKAYSQLQEYDETVLFLENMKTSYSLLEKKYDSTSSQLQLLAEQHEHLKVNFIEEMTINTPEDHRRLQQDYAEAMARLEILQKSNEEFGDMDAKLSASEVRATMLELDLEQGNRKLLAAKKKQEERESQLKEVISQYKTLKRDHQETQLKLERLKKVVGSGWRVSIVETTNSIPESRNSTDDSVATKSVAMTAKIVAYEGQITKLQQQRDSALEQMKILEEELEQAKKQAILAIEAKKSRENDLKIVLQHYEKLQNKYEATSKQFEDMIQKYQETPKRNDSQSMAETVRGNVSSGMVAMEEREIETLPNWDAPEVLGTKEDDEQARKGSDRTCDSRNEKDEVSVGKIEAPEDEVHPVHQSSLMGDLPEVKGIDSGVPKEYRLQDNEREDDECDDGSIAQLLLDMEHLKQQKAEKTMQAENPTGLAVQDDVAGAKVIADSRQESPLSLVSAVSGEKYETLTEAVDQVKESPDWKNEKIARVLCELKASQELVEHLQLERNQLQDDLTTTKSQFLLAKRETDKAEERQGSRETHLRTAVAKQFRLQQAYESLQSKFEKVQHELAQAQKETKLREEELKSVRKRASAAHAQFKKLQTDHSAVLERLSNLEQELLIYKETSLCVEQQEY